MPKSPLCLSNLQARSLWLQCQHLLEPPLSAHEHHRLGDTINALGMVQLDTVGVLARAHDHILWSRHNSYRNTDFYRLSSHNREVFEHFSHDAVILPLSSYPYWQRQFKRKSHNYAKSIWGEHSADAKAQQLILKAIRKNGPMCSQDFTRHSDKKADKSVHSWMRPPHKLALDYLWLAGDLSVSHREGFIKFYDLTDRVIPSKLRSVQISDAQQIDWLCTEALKRLGFATAREIKGFFDACTLAEVNTWLVRNKQRVQTLMIESANKERCPAFAFKDVESRLATLPGASGRLRIVNPFDPVVRDRDRLKRLFGFDYRIEIYVPANKRRYGYYVCPILEGTKFTGRIEVRADKKRDRLVVLAWWLEKGVKCSAGRTQRLSAELHRLARLTGVSVVDPIPSPST